MTFRRLDICPEVCLPLVPRQVQVPVAVEPPPSRQAQLEQGRVPRAEEVHAQEPSQGAPLLPLLPKRRPELCRASQALQVVPRQCHCQRLLRKSHCQQRQRFY